MQKTLIAAILAIFAALTPAKAAMTDWVEVQGGAVRLISNNILEDGQYLAGLEFLLEPGWHTYWRYPGEAGIPPQITVTAQDNIVSHDVLYPVPERYNDGFSESIVYHDGIILPILITPENPDQPVRLALDLFFGICKDICVPGDAQLAFELAPNGERDRLADKLIRRDLSAVPPIAANNGLTVESTVPSPTDGGLLDITVSVPAGTEHDLFAAGPEGSFIGLPRQVSFADGKAVWRLSTKGLRTTENDRTLILVVSDGQSSAEHHQPIDPSWVR